MRKSATPEGREVGLWYRADEMTGKIERLRWGKRANDLAKSFPGQVGIGGRPADVVRVPFGEPDEYNG